MLLLGTPPCLDARYFREQAAFWRERSCRLTHIMGERQQLPLTLHGTLEEAAEDEETEAMRYDDETLLYVVGRIILLLVLHWLF